MNEKFKQLALEAKMGTADFDAGSYYVATPDRMQLFAELIVQECVKLNIHQSHELIGVITDVEEGDGFDDVCLSTVKRIAEHLAKDLLEHFEVER